MDIVDRTLARLTGLPCWGVHWERYVGLSFSFGAPRLRVREPIVSESRMPRVQRHFRHRIVTVKGEWWFWSWYGAWQVRLADDDRPVNAFSSSRRRAEALSLLDGQRLLAAGVDPADGSTEFLFDLGAALRLCAPTDTDPDDIWSLYNPYGRVLVVRADGAYSNEMGSHDERWRPRR